MMLYLFYGIGCVVMFMVMIVGIYKGEGNVDNESVFVSFCVSITSWGGVILSVIMFIIHKIELGKAITSILNKTIGR